MPMVQAANAALLERTTFAIDDAKDDDEDSESDIDGEDNDDQVMDEVMSSFLFVFDSMHIDDLMSG